MFFLSIPVHILIIPVGTTGIREEFFSPRTVHINKHRETLSYVLSSWLAANGRVIHGRIRQVPRVQNRYSISCDAMGKRGPINCWTVNQLTMTINPELIELGVIIHSELKYQYRQVQITQVLWLQKACQRVLQTLRYGTARMTGPIRQVAPFLL